MVSCFMYFAMNLDSHTYRAIIIRNPMPNTYRLPDCLTVYYRAGFSIYRLLYNSEITFCYLQIPFIKQCVVFLAQISF